MVGGGAVELYSGGTYVTGDLDIVGQLSPQVQVRLREAGFARTGRHWIHEESQTFIEVCGSHLAPGEEATLVELGGSRVVVLSPEDTLVDRLAAWQFWKSPADGINAFHLWWNVRVKLQAHRLEMAASCRGVSLALERLLAFGERSRVLIVAWEEIERWAKDLP